MVGRSRLAEAGVKADGTDEATDQRVARALHGEDGLAGRSPPKVEPSNSGDCSIMDNQEWKRWSRRMAVTSCRRVTE